VRRCLHRVRLSGGWRLRLHLRVWSPSRSLRRNDQRERRSGERLRDVFGHRQDPVPDLQALLAAVRSAVIQSHRGHRMLHTRLEEWKMRTLVARIVIAALVALAVAVGGSPPTFASSDLSTGTTRTQDPLNLRDTGVATCRLFIGPMDGVPDGQF